VGLKLAFLVRWALSWQWVRNEVGTDIIKVSIVYVVDLPEIYRVGKLVEPFELMDGFLELIVVAYKRPVDP
jgi:hypothetical protein